MVVKISKSFVTRPCSSNRSQLAHLTGVCMQTGLQNRCSHSGAGGKDVAPLCFAGRLLSTQNTDQRYAIVLQPPSHSSTPPARHSLFVNHRSGRTAGLGSSCGETGDPATRSCRMCNAGALRAQEVGKTFKWNTCRMWETYYVPVTLFSLAKGRSCSSTISYHCTEKT